MTSRNRRSLADRDEAAILAAVESPKPVTPAPAATGSRAAPVRATRGSGTRTVRIGVYFRRGEFDAARAAYLADWAAGGEADTLARWVGTAMTAHAARTPLQRAKAERTHDGVGDRADTRSFSVPSAAVERMRAAIEDDHQHGRWPTDSAWCGDAIAAAVEHATQRAGGRLPAPPARLPNRLVR